MLGRLTAVEGIEHFLDKAYLAHQRFIEGVDVMVPMLLDLVIELASARCATSAWRIAAASTCSPTPWDARTR